MKFNQTLVIYNKKIEDCFLLRFNDMYICDNSTDDNIKECNVHYASLNYDKFVYIDMQGNMGLAKAYNKAIDVIKPGQDDYIIIFDQDTHFCADIFDRYIKYIEENPHIDIVCPVVIDSVGVMSPSLILGMKYTHLSSIKEIGNKKINDFSFINSGMCIKGAVFSKIKYDEHLFLDFVDHDFIIKAKTEELEIGICDEIILHQEFSGVTKNSFEQDFTRFQIYAKDSKVFYQKNYKKDYRFILLKRALKLCFIHKRIVFLKELFKKN
ncbi:MAG: glycosyltransferase [Spirochaetaceae bacterium]|nr:glycosyltransferase [Spirochaetaceae bacterium]